MPNNLELIIIGAGLIAQEYCKVLLNARPEMNFAVVCRQASSADKIKQTLQVTAHDGGHQAFLTSLGSEVPKYAIVAVDMKELYPVTRDLINHGIPNILVEKPGALNFDDLEELNTLATKKDVNIKIAYNRRFYSSVLHLINEVFPTTPMEAMRFEFTEWPSRFTNLFDDDVLKSWILANASHVIDLAFFLAGAPSQLHAVTSGKLPWHDTKIFTGSGITEKNIPFSYHADWGSAGRWSVECFTAEGKWILSPLEALSFQKSESMNIQNIPIDNHYDLDFKPGYYLQVQEFLATREGGNLLRIEDYTRKKDIYQTISSGGFIESQK